MIKEIQQKVITEKTQKTLSLDGQKLSIYTSGCSGYELSICSKTGVANFLYANDTIAERIMLTKRECRLLISLISNANNILARDALITSAWPGRIICQNTLAVNISRLRGKLRSIGLDVKIKNLVNVGYLFECDGYHHHIIEGTRIIFRRFE